jgi:hypothetical protein
VLKRAALERMAAKGAKVSSAFYCDHLCCVELYCPSIGSWEFFRS